MSCRQVGKRGSDGARCHWVAAERRGSKSLSCRGTSELRSARARLRFKRSGCRKDGGATGLNKTMPDRLAKKGLEATDAFCWGLLGRGFNCSFEARKFADRTYDCSGTHLLPEALPDSQAELHRERRRNRGSDRSRIDAGRLRPESARDPLPRVRRGLEVRLARLSKLRRLDLPLRGRASAAAPRRLPDRPVPASRAPDRSPRGSANPALHFGINEAWGQELGELNRAGRLGGDTLRTNLTWAERRAHPGRSTTGAHSTRSTRGSSPPARGPCSSSPAPRAGRRRRPAARSPGTTRRLPPSTAPGVTSSPRRPHATRRRAGSRSGTSPTSRPSTPAAPTPSATRSSSGSPTPRSSRSHPRCR